MWTPRPGEVGGRGWQGPGQGLCATCQALLHKRCSPPSGPVPPPAHREWPRPGGLGTVLGAPLTPFAPCARLPAPSQHPEREDSAAAHGVQRTTAAGPGEFLRGETLRDLWGTRDAGGHAQPTGVPSAGTARTPTPRPTPGINPFAPSTHFPPAYPCPTAIRKGRGGGEWRKGGGGDQASVTEYYPGSPVWSRDWPARPPQPCVGQRGQHEAAPRFSPGSPPGRRASGNTGILTPRPLPASWVSKPCPSSSWRLPRIPCQAGANGWVWGRRERLRPALLPGASSRLGAGGCAEILPSYTCSPVSSLHRCGSRTAGPKTAGYRDCAASKALEPELRPRNRKSAPLSLRPRLRPRLHLLP